MTIAKFVSNVLALVVTIGNSVWRIHGNNKEERCSRMSKEQSASVEMSAK